MSSLPVFWREDFESLAHDDLVEVAFQMQAHILNQGEQIETLGLIIDELKKANEILRGML